MRWIHVNKYIKQNKSVFLLTQNFCMICAVWYFHYPFFPSYQVSSTHFCFGHILDICKTSSLCSCLIGVWVANAFGFVVRKIFLLDISGFLDLKFSVQSLAFCRKKPIYFKPSCFHFYGNLSIFDIGYTHPMLY